MTAGKVMILDLVWVELSDDRPVPIEVDLRAMVSSKSGQIERGKTGDRCLKFRGVEYVGKI